MARTAIEAKTPPAGATLARALREAHFKVAVVDGAAADTNIAITGLVYTAAAIAAGTADTLICILQLNRDATAANIDIEDLTAEAQAGSTAGNFQLSTTATTGDTLLVFWADRD